MQCAAHPEVETELACSRCEKGICPRCLVHTPVGARCRECANVRRLPQYNLSTETYARAIGAALVIGVVTGIAWWLFNFFTYGFFFAFFVGFGIGYVVGEGVAVAANRRVGPPLQVIAAAGVIVAYLTRTGLLVVADNLRLADLRGFEAFALVALAIGAYIAAQRVR